MCCWGLELTTQPLHQQLYWPVKLLVGQHRFGKTSFSVKVRLRKVRLAEAGLSRSGQDKQG